MLKTTISGNLFFSKWQQIRTDVDRCDRHANPVAIGIISVMPAPGAEEYEKEGGEEGQNHLLRRGEPHLFL